MFAPHCPRCATRVLLGSRRIVRSEPTPRGGRIVLRCWCGTLVVDDLADPAPTPADPAPTPADPAPAPTDPAPAVAPHDPVPAGPDHSALDPVA